MGVPDWDTLWVVVKINDQAKYSYLNFWRSHGHLTWVAGRPFGEESRCHFSLGSGDIISQLSRDFGKYFLINISTPERECRILRHWQT